MLVVVQLPGFGEKSVYRRPGCQHGRCRALTDLVCNSSGGSSDYVKDGQWSHGGHFGVSKDGAPVHRYKQDFLFPFLFVAVFTGCQG